MTIKADHWIAQMAREHGMIEPFELQQVRAAPTGERVISYGLSSYGYDIRVADEFKIFTANPYNTVVDPKAIDPRAFQDFKGDVCIIPPNSYALCRSLEYFRIPKDVIVVVLGKSTYARCFRGDTRVALVDGRAPTLEEMARRYEDGEMFWGYSIGPAGRVIVTLLEAPRYIGRDGLMAITLDNGESIYCTPDHRFLLRGGRMESAYELRPGHSLMPLYRDTARGYEMVYQSMSGYFHSTHWLAEEWNVRNEICEALVNTHYHRLDHNGCNNSPWNVVRPATSEHVCSYNQEPFVEERGTSIRGALQHLYQNEEWYGIFRAEQREKVVTSWNEDRHWEDSHKVVTVRELPGDHDVYCLTVPEAGNFALEAGVFVHNCGIIVNVTPGEPGWEGHWTIEISNATPLPAKIYANEGIAQCLFFQSDSFPTISYADRAGKYQGQTGITLPRI
ncbi:MAG: hypothetical protein M5U01_11255 [Ardenticatenaceae bacterium]|nr:hypothetical protein [Ardenticatenaceae bacterium]HBY96944.1 dCTP deaminase [Chloroflexota bacterium]